MRRKQSGKTNTGTESKLHTMQKLTRELSTSEAVVLSYNASPEQPSDSDSDEEAKARRRQRREKAAKNAAPAQGLKRQQSKLNPGAALLGVMDGSVQGTDAFIPAKSWDGEKDGYVFANLGQGLGYYLLDSLKVAVGAAGAAPQGPTTKPVGNGVNGHGPTRVPSDKGYDAYGASTPRFETPGRETNFAVEDIDRKINVFKSKIDSDLINNTEPLTPISDTEFGKEDDFQPLPRSVEMGQLKKSTNRLSASESRISRDEDRLREVEDDNDEALIASRNVLLERLEGTWRFAPFRSHLSRPAPLPTYPACLTIRCFSLESLEPPAGSKWTSPVI